MMPAAPQADWRDLAAALVGAAADDDALAAPWKVNDEHVRWFSRSSWALAAIVEAWRRRNEGR